MGQFRAAIVTISDSASQGMRKDASGDTLEEMLSAAGLRVTARKVVADERQEIAALLCTLCDEDKVNCVVTTGGTGIGPRDVTPEATRDVINRELPGMAEAMRMESLKYTSFAMTSRQVVGTRGLTLVINLPGSAKAVKQCLHVILPVLPHVMEVLAGHTVHDATSTGPAEEI